MNCWGSAPSSFARSQNVLPIHPSFNIMKLTSIHFPSTQLTEGRVRKKKKTHSWGGNVSFSNQTPFFLQSSCSSWGPSISVSEMSFSPLTLKLEHQVPQCPGQIFWWTTFLGHLMLITEELSW